MGLPALQPTSSSPALSPAGLGLVLLAITGLAACSTEERPTMNPGVDCVRCHTQATDVTLPSAPDAEGQRASDLVFSAAGTVFLSASSPASEGVLNVHLLIHNALTPDAGVDLVSNTAGNFYSAEQLVPQTGLSVELVYQGQSVSMNAHPTPIQLYGNTTSVVGVGCNGCHALPWAPTVGPDAGPAPFCPMLPDGGTSDATAGEACTGDLGCCSELCVGGVCATETGASGVSCTASDDCDSFQCVDGVCSDLPGENLHGCTSGADCRLGYCVGNYCAGAPGRITIPSGISFPDGGLVPGYP